ncbi:condensation domain-containing protein [Rhizobium sp. L1K21]|uniref:condensation domain-containing protein n=1 Tax=Rhizobium sp. L1K21 TaxID=2954933 RepID=UPI002093C532|nr:condensation domain-containing protein [Rhizobium sp. L1K21]MCO6187567.1 condensation domain-containing protein [Rhizobium sp. L1K21]
MALNSSNLRVSNEGTYDRLESNNAPEALWGNGEPSEYEERIWLTQQQNPETPFCYALAYQLSGSIAVFRLADAIRNLFHGMPGLDVRYHFDEDTLSKSKPEQPGEYLEILHADAESQIIEELVSLQALPWDLETQPPFRIRLFVSKDSVTLGMVLHRILDESWSAEDLLKGISRAFAGSPVMLPEKTGRMAANAGLSEATSPIEWAQRAGTLLDIGLNDVTEKYAATPWPQSARAYGCLIPADRLKDVAKGGLEPDRILAPIAARFAAFVCEFGGHDAVSVWLPCDPARSLGDNNCTIGAPQMREVVVHGNAPLETSLQQIMQSNDQDESRNEAASGNMPRLLVTWLGDPAAFISFQDITARRLTVPALERRPELALAVGPATDGNLRIQLTTGQAMSPNIGAFLLESFIRFITDTPAARPMMAATKKVDQDVTALRPVTSQQVETDEIAKTILAEFRDALDMPGMNAQDDFFDFGGHSLIATRIIGRLLSQHGIEVHFNTLFSYPTAAELAKHARIVEATPGTPSTGHPLPANAKTPLSLAQQSLWKAYAAFGFGEIFNIPFALRFLDTVDEQAFQNAFMDILERHPGLRTLFVRDGDAVYQQVVPIDDVPRFKWFWTSEESTDTDRHVEAGYHFDLSKELPLRLRFMRDAQTGEQLLSFLFHHIVLDEWSVNLMMDELAEAYRARTTGSVPHWDTTPLAFEHFAAKQSAEGVDQAHLDYWVNMLRGAPPPLPLFKNDPHLEDAQAEETSPAGGWVEMQLDQSVCDGLYSLARENNASLFNIAYAAIASTLYRLGASNDLVIGTSASGRTDPEFFDTIGYFTTLAAHRVQMSPKTKVGSLIAQVKTTINDSLPHSQIPLDLVEEALGMQPGRDHLFEVFIQIHAKNKLNGTLPSGNDGRIEFRQVDPDKHESLLGLQFEVMEEMIGRERSIRILMSYRADRYGPDRVESLRKATVDMFAQFARPNASARQLEELDLTTVG